MSTAILYIRVSTDEQAVKGYSMRNQEEQLIRFCQVNSISILQIIREDYSARTFNRPEWKNLLKTLNRTKVERPNLILITRWDRFSRNAGDAYYMIAYLKKMSIEVQAIEQILDLEVPENKLVLALYLAVSEVENDRRALNIKRALHKARQEGKWIGPAPKGYINKCTEAGKKYIVPLEPDATIIRNMFYRMAVGDMGLRELYRFAMKSGFKCSLNNFWHLMRNPVYCGKVKVPDFENEKEYVTSGIHEGLIPESLFEKVQEVLNRHSKKHNPHNHNMHFPFRGTFVCPYCSHFLTGSVSKGNTNYYAYYHCYNGCKFRIRAAKIDEQFAVFLQEFNPPEIVIDLFRIILKKQSNPDKTIFAVKQNQITKHLEYLLNRSIKAKELFLKGEIEQEDFEVIKTDCGKQNKFHGQRTAAYST
jgi:DNA invertase Pin-like site-specific DNA recombinase